MFPHLPLSVIHRYIRFDHSKNLYLLYILRVINDLVAKLALFFVPIFLFTQVQEVVWLNQFGLSYLQKGILALALYYGIERLMVLVLAIPAYKIMQRVGFRASLAFGQVGYVLLLFFLQLSTQHFWLAFVAAAISGLGINFFWNSYNILMCRNMRKSHTGSDLSMLSVLLQLVAVVVPAVGGVIGLLFGFSRLFSVSFIFSLAAFLVIAALEVQPVWGSDNLAKIKTSWRQISRIALGLSGKMITDLSLLIWPVYIWISIGDIRKVGYIQSMGLLVALVIAIATGMYIDRHKRPITFIFSGLGIATVWIGRMFVFGFWSIAFVDTIDKLLGNAHWLQFDARMFSYSKGNDAPAYFVLRELIISAVSLLFWISLVVLALLGFNWHYLFLGASIAVLFTILLPFNH